jgi:hypothetical protein
MPPPPPLFYGETLAQEAITRVQAAIAAAPAGSAFVGLYFMQNRWQEVPDGTLKALSIHFAGERGAGMNRHIPQFELTSSLHINAYAAVGREDGVNPDVLSSQIARAVLELLLEDTTYLQLFAWVEDYDFEKADATIGKDATRYDSVVFTIKLELKGGQTIYAPAVPAAATPLQVVDTQLTPTIDGEAADIMVEQEIELPQ